jgi:hypothetical protein
MNPLKKGSVQRIFCPTAISIASELETCTRASAINVYMWQISLQNSVSASANVRCTNATQAAIAAWISVQPETSGVYAEQAIKVL